MYKYKNKSAYLNGKKYEIFWITDFAQHIMNRKDHHSHKIDLKQIEEYSTTTIFYEIGKEWFGFFKHNDKYYQAIAYFIEKPRRCVIKTSHVVNIPKYIELCKSLKL